MSKMVIEKNLFTTKDEVLQDIRKTGYWPTTFVSDKSPELPVHYHNDDILVYVMSGETYLLAEDGDRCPIQAADKFTIPKGPWHVDGEVSD